MVFGIRTTDFNENQKTIHNFNLSTRILDHNTRRKKSFPSEGSFSQILSHLSENFIFDLSYAQFLVFRSE